MKKLFLPLLLTTVLLPLPASAQTADNAQLMERLDRMDHDLMLLQRQVARGGSSGASISSEGDVAGGSAQLEVRLSGIEDQLRDLRGKVEEDDFQNKKLAESLDKLQKDTDYRFGELSHAAPGAKPPSIDTEPKQAEATTSAPAPGQTTGGDGVLRLPAPDQPAPDDQIKTTFATPREHYNYAFRLLNQTQYDAAAKSFEAFTKKYPKDPLVGNAYYWEGETYYIRRDYVNAADDFRQGFEAMPEGPKAADNLLKLAMSLDALNRDKEACVVLSQITAKFKQSSTSVTEKAQQEQKRIGCK